MDTVPFRTSPMLATLTEKPFAKPNWLFEVKYDGVRMIAYKDAAGVSLISRNAIDRTTRYPKIAAALAGLKARTLVLDGEVVMFDRKQVSRFQLLQQGGEHAQYIVFDCLYANGEDLRGRELSQRRALLKHLVKPVGPIALASELSSNGLAAFRSATKQGFEGIVAKDLSSAYVPGRSAHWLKVKSHQEEEFVIGGFTEPSGARNHFGALLLGVYSNRGLRYVGKVGTGFSERTLGDLYRRFQRLASKSSPFSNEVRERDTTFVKPRLVAQIAFTEWTKDGKLRQPVYLGLRDDKNPKEVVRQT